MILFSELATIHPLYFPGRGCAMIQESLGLVIRQSTNPLPTGRIRNGAGMLDRRENLRREECR